MVTVPGAQDIGAVQRSLVNQPGPVSLASADAFGAQIARADQEIGRATARAGEELSDRVLQEAIADNIREMKEGLNEYGKLKTTILNGDGTEENPGFLNHEGQAAIDALQGHREQLTEGQEAISKGLRNDRQRQLFTAAVAGSATAAQGSLNDHTSKQRDVANVRTAKVRARLQASNATLDYNDPKAMADNFARAQAEWDLIGRAQGLRGDNLAAFISQQVSSVAVSAVEGAIAQGDMAQAKKLFDQYKKTGQLEGIDQPALQKKLKAGVTKFGSQQEADKIFAQFSGSNAADVAARLKAARAITDPDVREATLERVTKFNAEQARALTAKNTQDFKDSTELVANGMATADVPALANMIPSQRNSLRALEARTALGVPVVSSPGLFALMRNKTPEELIGTDLTELEGLLSPAHFKIIAARILAAETAAFGTATATAKFTNPFTVGEKFNRRIGATFEKDQLTKQEIDGIAVIYEDEVEALGTKQKSRVTNDQMDTILDSILDPVILQGSIFGPGPFTDDPPVPLVLIQVPDKHRAALTADFKAANGRLPDAQELKRAYVDFLERENE